jgi:microcystin-dependent protein
MAEPFIGEIRMFGFNFAPRNWAMCNGQIIPISQNTALFSLLGITYGGNGTTTYALPNLQGSAVINAGQGPGLTNRVLGEHSGVSTVTLTASQMPVHTHNSASTVTGNVGSPANATSAVAKSLRQPVNLYSNTGAAAMNPAALPMAGGGQPHNNLPPYLVVNFCIALFGVFPSRN